MVWGELITKSDCCNLIREKEISNFLIAFAAHIYSL